MIFYFSKGEESYIRTPLIGSQNHLGEKYIFFLFYKEYVWHAPNIFSLLHLTAQMHSMLIFFFSYVDPPLINPIVIHTRLPRPGTSPNFTLLHMLCTAVIAKKFR